MLLQQCNNKFQIFLVAIVLVFPVAANGTSSTTAGGQTHSHHSADGAVEKVTTELATAIRPVLLFAKLPDRILLIVGSSGAATMATTNLDDTYVFDQSLASMKVDGSSVLLTSMKKIKTRWTQLTGSYTAAFAVGKSIILVDGKSGVSVLDIASGTVAKMTLNSDGQGRLRDNLPLSSSRVPIFYYTSSQDKSVYSKLAFDNADLLKAKATLLKDQRYLCQGAGQQQIKIQGYSCTGQPPVSWSINAGYIDDVSVVLVEQSNSIITFSGSAFAQANGATASVKRIPAGQFWQHPAPVTSTEARRNLSSVTTQGTFQKYSKWIFIGGSLLVGIIFGCVVCACIFCCCKKTHKPKAPKNAAAAEPVVVAKVTPGAQPEDEVEPEPEAAASSKASAAAPQPSSKSTPGGSSVVSSKAGTVPLVLNKSRKSELGSQSTAYSTAPPSKAMKKLRSRKAKMKAEMSSRSAKGKARSGKAKKGGAGKKTGGGRRSAKTGSSKRGSTK